MTTVKNETKNEKMTADQANAIYVEHMNTVKELLRDVRKNIGTAFETDDVLAANTYKAVARDSQVLVNKLVNQYFDSALDTIRLLVGSDVLAGVERIHGKRGKPAAEVDPFV